MEDMTEYARHVTRACSRRARMGLLMVSIGMVDVSFFVQFPCTVPALGLDQQLFKTDGLTSIDAEYCTLRTEAAVRIPKDANAAEYAPLLCAGVTVFNSIRNMEITPGSTVAIQGLGGLGHLALQYSRKMGFRTVALSSSSNKKDFAKELGATDYIDTSKENAAEALKKMGGASLIVVTAPNPELMGPLVDGLAFRGKLLILARM